MASDETPTVDALDDALHDTLAAEEDRAEQAGLVGDSADGPALTEILGEASEADAVEQRALASYDGDDDYR